MLIIKTKQNVLHISIDIHAETKLLEVKDLMNTSQPVPVIDLESSVCLEFTRPSLAQYNTRLLTSLKKTKIEN